MKYQAYKTKYAQKRKAEILKKQTTQTLKQLFNIQIPQ